MTTVPSASFPHRRHHLHYLFCTNHQNLGNIVPGLEISYSGGDDSFARMGENTQVGIGKHLYSSEGVKSLAAMYTPVARLYS